MSRLREGRCGNSYREMLWFLRVLRARSKHNTRPGHEGTNVLYRRHAVDTTIDTTTLQVHVVVVLWHTIPSSEVACHGKKNSIRWPTGPRYTKRRWRRDWSWGKQYSMGENTSDVRRMLGWLPSPCQAPRLRSHKLCTGQDYHKGLIISQNIHVSF